MAIGRRGRKAVLIVSAVVGALAIAAMLAFDPLVRWLTVERARDDGVELTLGRVRAAWGRAELSRFSVQLVGVSRLVGEVDRLVVDLNGLRPAAIEVHGARVDAWGPPAELAMQLGLWTALYPTLRTLPLRGAEVSLSWRREADAEPWLSVHHGVVATDGAGGGSLDGALSVAGVDLGSMGLSWNGQQARMALALGGPAPGPLQLALRWAEVPRIGVALAPTDLERLFAPLGWTPPARGVRLSGRMDLEVTALSAPLTGMLDVTVAGFALPLPAELKAIVSATTTEVTSRLRVRTDPPELALQDLKVVHGGLVLGGEGRVAAQDGEPRAWLTLSGQLACADLARSAVGGRVGGAIGQLVGGLAGRAVGGVVRFVVEIEADPRRLAEATVEPKVTIACDLRPGQLLPQLSPKDSEPPQRKR